tara:strand:- start:1591 stop:2544 length:954 start_codon:yes stop_codon:yes gene_type:complete
MDRKYFEKLIGQETAKKNLGFLIENYRDSSFMPHLLLVAPRGTGKTMLARGVAKYLVLEGEDSPKNGEEINCADIKNVSAFKEFLFEYVIDKDVTIHLDEASELPRQAQMLLLSILETNDSNKTEVFLDGDPYEFDFLRQTFIFSTTDAQKINRALQDRLKRIDLQNYDNLQMAKILELYLSNNDIYVSREVSTLAATTLRGSARRAVEMSNFVKAFLNRKNEDEFLLERWNEYKTGLCIMPLGISHLELNILRVLNRQKGTSLTQLAAVTGMSPESLRQDGETFLLKNFLMKIEAPFGRVITAKGRLLLSEAEKGL